MHGQASTRRHTASGANRVWHGYSAYNLETKHGLEAALVAVELVLESGNLSVEHIENVPNRLKPSPPPAQVETHLGVKEAPIADTVRYDGLRVEVSHA